jgi:NTP pyrophosphatase (non-canonical NTP hydrolase)
VSDGLVDILDSLVDTGVAAGGDVTISVAGVDLIALRLKALLASVGTEGADDLAFPRRERRERRAQLPARVETDEHSLQRGLAQLVLVLVEILGELLERQAVRRMAAGSLTDEEAEKLGAAFLALHRRVDELYDELVGSEAAEPGLLSRSVLAP